MHPRRQSRVTSKRMQFVEGPDKGLLRAFPRHVIVSRHAIRQSIDPVDVLVIELTLGRLISFQYSGDELPLFVHLAPELVVVSAFSM